ncbi:MAG: response regulator [Clostridium sp.]|nr:response regulator [Clostridium sp.]
MGLLNVDVIEDLVHSSSVSKGIERTMEHIINELGVDSMYIIHCEEEIREPAVTYEWEGQGKKRQISLTDYIRFVEEHYHFDEEDLFVARATTVLPSEEKQIYQQIGYEAVVEYRMTNHGNVVGYIVSGWESIKELSDEDINALHVLLKLMNEMLLKQFFKDIIGESDWRLFKLEGMMTKSMMYMLDEEYRILYINNYAKEKYPNIQMGDYCYQAIRGCDSVCKECPLKNLKLHEMSEGHLYIPYLEDSFYFNGTKVKTEENRDAYVVTLQTDMPDYKLKKRRFIDRKFIFAMKSLFKDMIAVEMRRDTFYDLFKVDMDNRLSYSMDFVLKWLSKVHLDDKQKFLECFDINFLQNAFMNGERKKEIDFRYRTHEGTYHCMHGNILFEQNTNKEITAYILFQDVEQVRSNQIEEYRQMRESLMAAKSSAELKGQILANISHEIRTPMSGIISMSSVARQTYQDEDRLLECLSNIDDYTAHMVQVMDSLLQVIKVDDDAITIAQQPFRLESFLNHIDVAVREKIEKNNIQFTVRSFCRYNRVVGDRIRLEQALQYLLNNAVSCTPISGVIRLTARQVAADSSRVFIRFIIEDTGNGMTEKMKQCIFGFSQDEGNTAVEEQHFDLSLASRLIQLMGGQIGMEENANGTQIYFTIPFGIQEEVQSEQAKKKMIPAAGDFNGRRILFAEDSEMGRDAIRAVLEVVGFTVDAVDNGKKAVIQFVSQPAFTYDAVLMDVHMPYMDGREAARCIRISGKEDGETIPIIALMTDTYDEDVEESLQAGMQAHLGKPVDVDTLYKVLGKVIPDKKE